MDSLEMDAEYEWDLDEINSLEFWLDAISFVLPHIEDLPLEQQIEYVRTWGQTVAKARAMRVGEGGYNKEAVDFMADMVVAGKFGVVGPNITRELYEYVRTFGVDQFLFEARDVLKAAYPQIRRASQYYLSIPADAYIDIVSYAAQGKYDDIRRYAEMLIEEGRSPRSVYFNLYYIARATGDREIYGIAREIERLSRKR
ncbi:hypothetical protein TTSV1_gp22 [Thermoproteus tenax spherical virus 1]|uniref:Uncharacterized protein n=1 Tax=Thermoproteus tenax spherical virus 1 TaxID=292639 RepID=Q647E0_9VIRU|nr:hypothetical protein TTSV1_gp22 [Thermoproteus tenax spherical virus 1]AAU25972.1 hypothetical protein [Thermoproteus tenax spherical virus 1]